METDALIDSLSADLVPVAPGATARRLGLGLGLGAVASAALMLGWLGPRPDIAHAVATPMFWVKLGYAAVLGLVLSIALGRLARPAAKVGALGAMTAAPFLVLAVMAALRLAAAEPGAHAQLLMGGSASLCPWRILLLSLPLMAGAVWALRGLAPTRLTLAGLVAGGCAGGFGAAIYAIACDETAAPFVAVWYTLGMLLAAALGGLGSRWLRWR